MSNMKTRPPLIGVSGCRKQIVGQDYDCAGRKYTRAIEDACDGVPLIIPTTGDKLDRESLLHHVDGLLFTGSLSNVEPHHYEGGESADPNLHDPHRDATTLPLIREAVAVGIPVFCICRGFQEMIVAFGGTLYQEVHKVKGMMDHRENPELSLEERYAPVHDIDINPDGFFSSFLDFSKTQVNSLHGQGCESLSDDLIWEAKAPDGLIEGVSVKGAKTFACAVQWHPEWKVMENPLYLSLFRAFSAACMEHMDKP